MAYNHKPFFSKISFQGKNADELSYVFSSGPIEQQKCSVYLFGVFAISSSNEVYQQFIKQTVKHFVDFYNRADNLGNDQRIDNQIDQAEFVFENAIQYIYDRVTSGLIAFQEERKRSVPLDIKKIHCILGCLVEGTVYISSTGSVLRSYYIYPSTNKQGISRHSITAIVDQQPYEDQSQRLFSHIISGNVGIAGGAVCIATLSLLDYISLEQLKQIITTQYPESLSQSLERMLGRANARNDMSALFIHPTYSGTEHSDLIPNRTQTAANKSMEELNSRQRGTDTVMSPSKALRIEKIFPPVKKVISLGLKHIARAEKWLFQPATWNRVRVILGRVLSSIRRSSASVAAFVKGVKKYRFNRDYKHSIVDFFSKRIRKPILGLYDIVKEKFLLLPIASRYILVLSVFFIGLFIYSLFALDTNRKSQQHRASVDAIITSIQQKYSEAEARLIFKNDTGAGFLLNEIRQLIENVPTPLTDTQKKSLEEIQKSITGIELKLSHAVTIPSPSQVAVLEGLSPDSSVHISTQDKSLFISDPSSLFFISSLSAKPISITPPPSVQSVRSTTLASQKTFYIATADGQRAYEIDSTSNAKQISLPLSKTESGIGTFLVYNGNIYNHDFSSGTIYKHTKQGGGFSSGADWIKEKSVDLHEILDMDIDGKIYILKSSNQLYQYVNGKPQPIPLPAITPTPSTITRIDTEPQGAYLFLLESKANRIIILDKKTFALIAQITSPAFHNIRDIQFYPPDGSILILDGRTLYKVPLKDIAQ